MSKKYRTVTPAFGRLAGIFSIASMMVMVNFQTESFANDGGFFGGFDTILAPLAGGGSTVDENADKPILKIQAQVTNFGGSGVIAKADLGGLEFNTNQIVELEAGKHYVGNLTYLMITHNPETRVLYTEQLDFVADWSGEETMKVVLKKFQFRGEAELPQGLKMPMAEVLPGKFLMGEKAFRHNVTLSQKYWIGKYEVTQAQYEAVMSNNPSSSIGADLPVEQVSWTAAMEFCKRLTEYEANAGRLPDGYAFSLPTEAQWEFAARGGNNSKNYKYSGSNVANDVAWYHENAGQDRLADAAWNYQRVLDNKNTTHPVGQKEPNELGIYDMSGNVAEWCFDTFNWYCNDDKDPFSSSNSVYRTFKGGAYDEFAWRNTPGYRNRYYAYSRNNNVGFRVVLAPVRDEKQQRATAVLMPNDVSNIPYETE